MMAVSMMSISCACSSAGKESSTESASSSSAEETSAAVSEEETTAPEESAESSEAPAAEGDYRTFLTRASLYSDLMQVSLLWDSQTRATR